MAIEELRALLALLKESGVTRYRAADLEIELRPSGGEWTDFRSQIRKSREEEEEEEEAIQFAHVRGGPPPRFAGSPT